MGLWSGFDKTNVSLEHLGSRLKQIGSCPQFLDNLGLLGPVLCFVSIWSGFDKTDVSLEHLEFRLKQVGSCTQFLDNLGLLGPVLRFVILDTNIFIRS